MFNKNGVAHTVEGFLRLLWHRKGSQQSNWTSWLVGSILTCILEIRNKRTHVPSVKLTTNRYWSTVTNGWHRKWIRPRNMMLTHVRGISRRAAEDNALVVLERKPCFAFSHRRQPIPLIAGVWAYIVPVAFYIIVRLLLFVTTSTSTAQRWHYLANWRRYGAIILAFWCKLVDWQNSSSTFKRLYLCSVAPKAPKFSFCSLNILEPVRYLFVTDVSFE